MRIIYRRILTSNVERRTLCKFRNINYTIYYHGLLNRRLISSAQTREIILTDSS